MRTLKDKNCLRWGSRLTILCCDFLGGYLANLKMTSPRILTTRQRLFLKRYIKVTARWNRDWCQREKELIDTLCQLHTCTDWNTWSDCAAKVKGAFGAQTRSRTCGINGLKLCRNSDKGQKDDEARVSEGIGQCPKNYTLTTNGFCIGIHKDERLNWTDAQDACKQEGGYLVNIDSDVKAFDVNNTLLQMSFTSDSWIDGTRTLPVGEWRYENAPRDPMYTYWMAGEPQVTDDCKAYYRWSNSKWFWYGRSCSSNYQFICEIV